jgi:aryl-alcohol dehydrogenase-like predicted oxidoreductase
MNNTHAVNKTTHLGDKPINRMGFGAMQLAGPGVFGPPKDADAARAVLRRAVELGVDHIDTSQFYGPNVVNNLIREALHPYPEQLKIVTKVGGARDDKGAWLPAQKPEELREGVEENLRTLEVERMDLVNLRIMDEGDGPPVPLEEQLGTLQDLQKEGKIDLIGISNVDLPRLQQAAGIVELGEVQNSYSIIDRGDEPLLDFCREHEIAFVPFFPLGSAFTGGPAKLAEDPTLQEIASKHGATTSQIALAWLLARYERMLLIPGTSSVAHLEENYAAIEVELDDSDMAALEVIPQHRRPLT